MNPLVAAIGLCFVVPAAWCAGLILGRWLTWPRTEGTVFRVDRGTGSVKLTYVVDGRQRTAVKHGWPIGSAIGDKVAIRYDPQRPFRHQVARPIWRTLTMIVLALAIGLGALIIVLGATGPRAKERIDLPWFVSMGLGLGAVAIGSWLTSYQWKRRGWRRADGTVTKVREQKTKDSSDGTTTVTYQVTYRFVDDVTEDIRSATTDTFFRQHETGQAVPVRYDPADPDRSDLSTARGRAIWWACAAALIAIGATLVMLGLVDASR